MKLSEEMLEVIRSTHKFTKEPWTSKFGITYIGYCHKIKEYDGNRLTRRTSLNLLKKDLNKIEKYVSKLLDNKTIPQNHFDVMCSIAYDIGNTAFKNSYFIKYYKKGLIEEACSRIMVWSYIKDQLSLAMEYRRDIDYIIFTESDYKYRGNIK